jgi:cardiolipin synthase
MEQTHWWATLFLVLDVVIGFGFTYRIIMRRLAVGVSLAWIVVVLIFPWFGAIIYLLFGELRLGEQRAIQVKRLEEPRERWLGAIMARAITAPKFDSHCSDDVFRISKSMFGMPALPGNSLELLDGADTIFESLVRDINAAKHTIHIEFYIWSNGGRADDVAEVLLLAAKRGVRCRVLLDNVGSRPFLSSPMAKRLRDGGIELISALQVGIVRAFFVRFDLRLHRKVVVIDGKVGYTGSFNLVDPRFFKQSAGVGEWVDAMVRVQGPVVEALAVSFLSDWVVESHESVAALAEETVKLDLPNVGHAPVQVLPSGPTSAAQAIEQVVIQCLYAARDNIMITTPYFVPDETLVAALVTAAHRGVDITLILPKKVDSKLTGLAGQAFIGDLLEAGIHVALFDGGLLHTKSITIDHELSLFGSLNLDPRSFHLNFEITLAIYDAEFTTRLRSLQEEYITRSTRASLSEWQSRTRLRKFADNTARLLGPLL